MTEKQQLIEQIVEMTRYMQEDDIKLLSRIIAIYSSDNEAAKDILRRLCRTSDTPPDDEQLNNAIVAAEKMMCA